jgi:hypothetical protein
MLNQQSLSVGYSLEESNFNLNQGSPFEQLDTSLSRSSSITNDKPQVGITLSPTTVVEASDTPLLYSFNLSEVAPKGGLQLKFLIGDSDGGENDATAVGFESFSSNITDTSFVFENGSAFFLVGIAEGAKAAKLAVGAFEDNLVEGDETFILNLVDNKNSYTINSKNSFAIATIKDAEISTSPTPKTINFDESWSFQINDYAIEHQGNAIIDIDVSYDYIDGIGVPDPLQYPDFVPIYKFIDNFLVNYPNETDFWEILNKNLVQSLLTEPVPTPYGIEYKLADVLDSLTIKIDIEPGSSGINIPRSSIVTGFTE